MTINRPGASFFAHPRVGSLLHRQPIEFFGVFKSSIRALEGFEQFSRVKQLDGYFDLLFGE